MPTRVWLRDEKYYEIVKKKFRGKTAEKFFNTDTLVAWLDEHFSGKEDNSRRVWTVYVFLVWYDIYFDEDNPKVEKPVNHLDELKAVAEARREKQITAPAEVIMAAAEEAISGGYEAPAHVEQTAQEAVAEEATPEAPAEEPAAEPVDDGAEPALVESADEPPAAQEEADTYVNISNPEDDEVYAAPRRENATPQEKMQMAIDSIEKRSKYLDEPNVMSDEAIDSVVSQISFFDDEA